jgi:hypothetical protein
MSADPANTVDAAAAAPPSPPLSVPVAEKRKTLKPLHTVLLTCALTVLAVAIVLGVVPAMARWWRFGGTTPPVLHALATSHRGKTCTPIMPAELVQGTALEGLVNLRDVRATLATHMEARNFPGICAQHLEDTDLHVCICLLNVAYSSNDTANIVEMSNMRLTGVSLHRRIDSTERSIFCKNTYKVERFETITLEYVSAGGVVMERELSGRGALVAQQLIQLQRGKQTCTDSDEQAALNELRASVERLESMVGYVVETTQQQQQRNNGPLRLPQTAH